MKVAQLLGGGAAVLAMVAMLAAAASSYGSTAQRVGESGCGERGWASTAEGAPVSLSGGLRGYYVWHGGRSWHIRLDSVSSDASTGRISSNARLRLTRVSSDAKPGLDVRGRSFSFRLSGGSGKQAIDFTAACASRLSFRFGPERPAGSPTPSRQVFLGARGHSPGASFVLQRPIATGVAGRILLGPTCPVLGPGVVCPPAKPMQGSVRIETAPASRSGGGGGQFVTTVESDASGDFSAKLQPGRYLLTVAKDDSSYPLPKPSLVEVEAGVVTQVSVLLDTGIR